MNLFRLFLSIYKPVGLFGLATKIIFVFLLILLKILLVSTSKLEVLDLIILAL